MLSNVLPGLRELRAPLAAGYLWLVSVWLILGDMLPTASEDKPGPLDRLYRLEPLLSDLGLAVVASVGAYVVGSIAIDLQMRTGKWLAGRWNALLGRLERLLKRDTGLAAALLARYLRVPKSSRDEPAQAKYGEGREAVIARLRGLRAEGSVRLTQAGEGMLKGWTNTQYGKIEWPPESRQLGGQAASMRRLDKATRDYIDSNRALLKTRLLNVSESLHSEVDRPDAEATFRMSLWPPIAVLVIYLALDVSGWWAFAVVLPVMLAWQWVSLRLQANDQLVAALVTREELDERAGDDVRRAVARHFTRSPEPTKPAGPPPVTQPPPAESQATTSEHPPASQ